MSITQFNETEKKLTENGQWVEAGWENFKRRVLGQGFTEQEFNAARKVFITGFLYAYSEIKYASINGLNNRLEAMGDELVAFEQEVMTEIYQKNKGSMN